ncbi:MAG: 2,3-diphosphoglycerate-dependent phosphoglycerate mutase [Desulfarculus sp.]|nr:2,3-diphosphoglycerate-dependent phosphoglycerate mutase [Desulfarculus sp.]
MTHLVLLRHGESLFNQEGRFAGWRDVDLTPVGCQQARHAGRLMARAGLELDLAFVSWLRRARRSLELALEGLGSPGPPQAASWRLNERHCGALEGLAQEEAHARFGARVVEDWRNDLETPPPPLEPGDPRHPAHDPRYAQLASGDLPAGESLRQVLRRLQPFWEQDLSPRLAQGQRVLVVGHGVCLWGLTRLLAGPSLPRFRMPNANPLLVSLGPGLTLAGLRYLDPDRTLPLP